VALWEGGGNGGAVYLSSESPLSSPFNQPQELFSAWANLSPATPAQELQASIARGEALFNNPQLFSFQLGNLRGAGCGSCHDQAGGHESAAPAAQRDTGVGGQSVGNGGPAPDPELPIFEIQCYQGKQVGPDGSDVKTNDPGLALITGKCADIGAFTVPPIRGLVARAPFFHDGSAPTILDIVNFYDKRFSIGLTLQQKLDLVSFLSAL
jgi:cytochrome c peroxidase